MSKAGAASASGCALSSASTTCSTASDIQYYDESQLPSEAAPVADIHLHPVEPRTVRLTVEMIM